MNASVLIPLLLLAVPTPQAQPRVEKLTLYVGNAKAGQLWVEDQPLPDGGWRMTRRTQIEVKRGAQSLTLKTEGVSEVGPNFVPRRYRYVRDEAAGRMSMEGVATCDKGPKPSCNLEVKTVLGGTTQTTRVTMPAGVTFASALEVQARQNLKNGNRFHGQALVEELGALQTLSYEVKSNKELVKDGFLVRTVLMTGAADVETLDHLDAQGRTLKSFTPAMQAVAVPEGSPPPIGAGDSPLDVLARSTWTGPRLPPNVQKVRFELKTTGNPLAPVPEDRRQKVIKREKNRVVVEVRRAAKGPPEVLTAEERKRALAATPYEPVGDARLVMAASMAKGSAKTPREIIAAVTRYVNELVEEKNLSRAYAPALTTLETRQGDCTEHSVLASALLRQNGIPTRLADGVIAMSNGKLGYHEWLEAYVDGEGWIPVDPTFGEPEAGPNRVKLANGTSEHEDLVKMGLSAAQAFRGLTVAVEGYDE